MAIAIFTEKYIKLGIGVENKLERTENEIVIGGMGVLPSRVKILANIL